MRLPPARATNFIVAASVASFVLLTLTGQADHMDLVGGFVPARLSGFQLAGALPLWITPLTATLLHGGILHIVFNMMMLLFCGRMVETAIGPGGMLLLYLAGAYASAGMQYLVNPHDGSPMIGASGAISAIFAGYAMLFGRPKGFAAHPHIAQAVNVVWLAAAWIGVQFLMGIAFADMGMAIATGAHVGGFLIGLALVRPLSRLRRRPV